MDTADFNAGRKIETPLLVTWGTRSHTGMYGDNLVHWRDYAADVTGGPIDCGHYVPEEGRVAASVHGALHPVIVFQSTPFSNAAAAR